MFLTYYNMLVLHTNTSMFDVIEHKPKDFTKKKKIENINIKYRSTVLYIQIYITSLIKKKMDLILMSHISMAGNHFFYNGFGL